MMISGVDFIDALMVLGWENTQNCRESLNVLKINRPPVLVGFNSIYFEENVFRIILLAT